MEKTPRMTKSQQRLFNLFKEIEDKDLQEIMIEVVYLEGKYRSGNFPIRKVRDVIDAIARLQESKEE